MADVAAPVVPSVPPALPIEKFFVILDNTFDVLADGTIVSARFTDQPFSRSQVDAIIARHWPIFQPATRVRFFNMWFNLKMHYNQKEKKKGYPVPITIGPATFKLLSDLRIAMYDSVPTLFIRNHELAGNCYRFLGTLDSFNDNAIESLVNFKIQECLQSIHADPQHMLSDYEISQYIKRSKDEGISWKPIHAAKLVSDAWAIYKNMDSVKIPTPVTITSDKTRAAFYYMDVDSLTDTGPIDAWTFIESFMGDLYIYFRAWLYGVFNSTDVGRQALWLYGEGQNGKTTICKAIEDSLPSNLVGVIPSNGLSEKWAGSVFFGKRLAVCSDNKNQNLLQYELIHAILGGDRASVEFKGEDSFRGDIFCKIFIASNFSPDVESYRKSEMSRCIYIPLRQRTEDQWYDDLYTKLKEQIWAYLVQCRTQYKALSVKNEIQISPDHSRIMFGDILSEQEITAEEFVTKNVQITHDEKDLVTPADLHDRTTEFARRYDLGKFFYGKVRYYLRTKNQIELMHPYGKPRVFKGIKLLPPAPQAF